MRQGLFSGLLCLLFVSSPSWATFLPPDEPISFSAFNGGASNITEDEFKVMIQAFQTAYEGIVSANGGSLSINGDWQSETVNASASQFFGTWQVNVYGGLARRPELTPDGLALVVCHEMGHHLAGFAFHPGGWGPVWAANEGQSDYYATMVCAPKMWGGDLEKNATFRETVSPLAKQLCDEQRTEEAEQNLCYRILAGSESLAQTLAVLKDKPLPAFDTPDANVVSSTFNGHPAPQCRIDTYLAGTMCTAEFNDNLVPGKKVTAGPGSVDAEREAANHSCTTAGGFTLGLRPACWFKARM